MEFLVQEILRLNIASQDSDSDDDVSAQACVPILSFLNRITSLVATGIEKWFTRDLADKVN